VNAKNTLRFRKLKWRTAVIFKIIMAVTLYHPEEIHSTLKHFGDGVETHITPMTNFCPEVIFKTNYRQTNVILNTLSTMNHQQKCPLGRNYV